jgi:hypothetical protein
LIVVPSHAQPGAKPLHIGPRSKHVPFAVHASATGNPQT